MNCPTCGAEMENRSISRDVYDHARGGVVGLDISQHVCPECETLVDDDGNAHTREELADQRAEQEAGGAYVPGLGGEYPNESLQGDEK